MKLEYGEYVKFQNGYIGKVENINDFREPSMKYAIDIQKDDLVFVGEDYIVKHRKKIIDLIEVGDYVNGKEVIELAKYDIEVQWLDLGENIPLITDNEDIKSIITKEQFEANVYKLEEK